MIRISAMDERPRIAVVLIGSTDVIGGIQPSH